MKRCHALAATLAVTLMSSNAFAQDAPAEPSKDCLAEPQADNGKQSGDQKPSTDGSLSAKLSDCNGVLKPPAVGDAGIAEPAPAQGETPIIKPKDLPEQPPAN